MKIVLPVICFVLLITSLFGVIKAFSSPPQISVTKEITLLDYRQQGKFDYRVTVKPSHLYGPEPANPVPSLPEVMKYPINSIDRIALNFDYRFVTAQTLPENAAEDIEITGVLRQANQSDTKTITLLPRTRYTGDTQVTLPLSFTDNSTDNYLDFGDGNTGYEMIITASVYSTFTADAKLVFESFTQSLPLTARGPMLVVNGELTRTESANIGDFDYQQHGQFSYQIYLKPSSLYSETVLDSPSQPVPTPSPALTVLTSHDVVINSLIENMDMDFTYDIISSREIKNLEETVTLEVILESPGKWSKVFQVVPIESHSGKFVISFPIDLGKYSEFFKTIQEEIGGGVNARNLTIKATVHANADTDYTPISTDFVHSITTDLSADILNWSANLTQVEPGQIKANQIVQQPKKFLWIPISQLRVISLVVTIILFMLLVLFIIRYLVKRNSTPAAAQKVLEAHSRHKGMIIEVTEIPDTKAGETVVKVGSLDDLLKNAENLMKPVLHQVRGEEHIYSVFDAGVRYEYRI
jgi:hypothetical protein